MVERCRGDLSKATIFVVQYTSMYFCAIYHPPMGVEKLGSEIRPTAQGVSSLVLR